MFTQTEGKVDTGRTRIISLAFLGALAIFGVGLLVVYTIPWGPSAGTVKGLQNPHRAGDPVFDELSQKVKLSDQSYWTSNNLLGQLLPAGKGKIVNSSDKTLTGIELKGTV